MAALKRGSVVLDDGDSTKNETEGKKSRPSLANENDGGPDVEELVDCSSDDEVSAESSEDRLTWRKDDAFSDWTIVIIVNNSNHNNKKQSPPSSPIENDSNDSSSSNNSNNDNTQEGGTFTYHVHKQNLALGPRRSEYFVRLFANDGNFSESHENTSRIELCELAATAFPQFLDYMYTTGKKMAFSVDTATALYSLAKYFDVKRLRQEVKKFSLRDMRRYPTCGTYYEHATILGEEKIREPAKQSCRENIHFIKPTTSRLLYVPDAQFWLDLLQQQAEQDSLAHIRIKTSRLVAMFCNNHDVSPQVFKQLTGEKYLVDRYIHVEAAVQFLDLERKILAQEQDLNHQTHDETAATAAAAAGVPSVQAAADNNNNKLSSLQLRCVNTIVRCKQNANFKGESGNVLLNLSPLILREIITRLVHGIPTTLPPQAQVQVQQPEEELERLIFF